jgi:tryptophan synthase alpha chain
VNRHADLTAAQRIGAAIRVRSSSGQPAVIAFLTAGYPARERFREHLTAVASAADVVEIGVPFSDPMADGVTIQRATHGALAAGVTLSWILEELGAMTRPATPLLLMSYLNPLLAFGLGRLAEAAARAGVAGFIVPDLPFEESDDLRRALAPAGLGLVQMVTPVTPPERLRTLCAASEGFVYAVTRTGTTGHNAAVFEDVLRYLGQVRGAAAALPVCAGFGIRDAGQVERLRGHVDGVIVGSALVETLERGDDPAAFIQSLRPRLV